MALTGLWHPNAPDTAMLPYLPKITLPAVIVAAAIDGINPYTFTVLPLFITVMLVTLQLASRDTLFSLLKGQWLDAVRRYCIKRFETQDDNQGNEEIEGQIVTEVKISFPMSHNTLTSVEEYGQ